MYNYKGVVVHTEFAVLENNKFIGCSPYAVYNKYTPSCGRFGCPIIEVDYVEQTLINNYFGADGPQIMG